MPRASDKAGRRGRRAAALVVAALSAWIVPAPAGAARSAADLQPASQPGKALPAAPKGARIVKEGWFAPLRPAHPPPELTDKVTSAFILPLREPISSKTLESFQRRVQWCKDRDAQLIVLDMDTWGGEVYAALEIARLLKLELQDVYTVCFVRTRAVSAGTLIALACNEIAVTTVGKLGDCAPIPVGLKLDAIEREKIEAVLRQELAESAELNGYPVALTECMVSLDREAWLVRHVRSRELRYVLKRDFAGKVRSVPGVSSQPARPKARWEVLRVLCSPKELLLLHPRLAVEYGFAARQVKVPSKGRPYARLLKAFHVVSKPVVLEDNWPNLLVRAEGPLPFEGIRVGVRFPRGQAGSPDRGGAAADRPRRPRAGGRKPSTRPTRHTPVDPADFPAAPRGARFARTDEGVAGWFAPPQRGAEPPALPAKITKAFVIPIREAITSKLYEAVKRKVLQVRAQGGQIVVFDMHTPGGGLGAMGDIVRLILEEMKDVYTVAYVHPRAYSAGAIVALACDEIVMAPTGVIGDAMPIMLGPQGIVPIPEKERGKIESATRSEIRVLAKRNGYNVALCEAMITITMEVWLIQNRKTGEFRLVDASEWRGKVAGTPAATQPSGPRATDSEWAYVKTIDNPKELVTLTGDEAVFVGLADHVFASMAGLKKHYNIVSEPIVLEDTWSERLVGFLTSTTVSSVLLMAGILCVYLEMNSPGFGVPGTLAVVCFAILFGSRYLIGMAAWWEIALFVLGLVLLALEIFVTPGFGVLGLSGIVCCIIALLAMVVPNAPSELPIPRTKLTWELFKTGVVGLILAVIGAVVLGVVLARYLPKVPVAGRLVLAPSRVVFSPTTDSAPILAVEVGDVGTVRSVCRPVGQVLFGDHLVDAVAEGTMIATGAKVRVIKKEGNRVVVTLES